jgi:hypothetical protein
MALFLGYLVGSALRWLPMVEIGVALDDGNPGGSASGNQVALNDGNSANKGVAPIKVMIAGGWRNLKTMQEYIRKSGVDVKGVCASLELHSQKAPEGKLIALKFGNVVD